MYGKTTVATVVIGTGRLASTGFGTTAYICLGVILLLGGALLLRWGRRRVAAR
jgi:LPXTG-motif cell wall-anchored protein